MKELAIQLIDDLSTSLIDYVKKKLQEKLKRKPLPEGTYSGASIHKFGDESTGYYALLQNNTILYFVRYKRISFSGNNFGRQILVWRDRSSPIAVGFSKVIFFKYLLPKYSALISDQLQSANGQAFWQFRCKDAFARKLKVYLYDRRVHPNELLELHSIVELDSFKHRIWGTDEGHKRVLLIISNKPLSLKRK